MSFFAWSASSGGGGGVGGSNTQVQYNDSGVQAGSAKFTFDKTTGALTLAPGGTSPTQVLYVDGSTIVNFDYLVNAVGLFNGINNQTIGRFVGTGVSGGTGRTTKSVTGSINGGTYSSSSCNIGFHSAMNTTNDYNDMDAFNTAAGLFGAFLDSSNGSTSGTSMGGAFLGRGGNKNVGVYGYAKDGSGTTPQNYGGRFVAVQATGAQAVGVYGRIRATASATTEKANPGVNAAIVGDNGDTTGDLLNLQDAGTTKVKVTDLGNVVLAEAARSTSATDGFTYIPTCAGAPSGTPTSYTGTVAMIFDTTNNKLYVYNGGWIGVTLA